MRLWKKYNRNLNNVSQNKGAAFSTFLTLHLKSLIFYSIILFSAGWCMVIFRADISRVSFSPVLNAWDSILLAALFSLLNYVLRIVRWRAYLSHLGYRLTLSFSALTFVSGFAFTLTPGKVGEMIRARYYKGLKIPLSSVAAAFFIERLMDLLAMVALALTAFAASSEYTHLLWSTIGLIALMLALLTSLPWNRTEIVLEKYRSLPNVLKNAFLRIARTFTSARILLTPSMLITGFVFSLAAWGLEGVGLQVISTMLPGASLDYFSAIGIYAVAIIVGALSFLPGGLGSTEAAMVVLLVAYGYSISDAILLTLIFRILTLWFAVALGWLAVLALWRRRT